jgi:O-acetylhomoserine/O-acetylserine sulfhydrylase-like pyridoxal-dependent enzyme
MEIMIALLLVSTSLVTSDIKNKEHARDMEHNAAKVAAYQKRHPETKHAIEDKEKKQKEKAQEQKYGKNGYCKVWGC